MRHKIMRLAGFLLGILAAALCGLALMTLVYLIPADRITENVARSAAVFEEEGTYPALVPWATSQLDNFTDAIMLLGAAYQGPESPVEKGMMVYRCTMEDCDPVEVLVATRADPEAEADRIGYPRYWHGYMVFLKPLLLVMDYTAVRRLNGVLQMLVIGLVLLLLYRKGLGRLCVPYLLSVLFLMPAATAWSLQFSSCFYIFSAGVVLQLCNDDPSRDAPIFLSLGIVTAFFDLLTYPIATFGIPAVIYLAKRPGECAKTNVAQLAKMLLSWGIGYVGMWGSKWILASLLTGEDVIGSALSQLFYRSSHYSPKGDTLTTRYALFINFKKFVHTPVMIVAAVFAVIMAAGLVYRATRGNARLPGLVRAAVPYLCLCLLPFLWYVCTVNHSAVHAFFTSKALSVTAFSGLCMLVQLYSAASLSPRTGKEPADAPEP